MLGNGRCEAMCIDGTKRLCHIRGKMHKKVWIAAGDIVLVGLRDYQVHNFNQLINQINFSYRFDGIPLKLRDNLLGILNITISRNS